jgi:hypothetical protein
MSPRAGPGKATIEKNECIKVKSGLIKVTLFRGGEKEEFTLKAGDRIDVRAGDEIRWQFACDY